MRPLKIDRLFEAFGEEGGSFVVGKNKDGNIKKPNTVAKETAFRNKNNPRVKSNREFNRNKAWQDNM